MPPSGSSVIGNTDDWLRMVFAHEYTHVVHLEKSRGWIGGLRKVFGRLPILYPNLFVPDWQIEGSGDIRRKRDHAPGPRAGGRLPHAARRGSASGRFAPLDRATSAVIDWPGGNSAYLYGAYFHQYLAERFGAETLTRLSSRNGRTLAVPRARVHSRTSTADRWANCGVTSRATLPSGSATRPRTEERTRLTHHGFTVTSSSVQPRRTTVLFRREPARLPVADGAAPGRNVANGCVDGSTATGWPLPAACWCSINSSSTGRSHCSRISMPVRWTAAILDTSDAAARAPQIRMSLPTDGRSSTPSSSRDAACSQPW